MTQLPDAAPTDAAAVPSNSRRNSALVASGILLSRLSGLARERVIASAFGVGPTVDAFRAALRIPNLLQNLLGEGVLSGSFIPVYARLLAEGEEEEAGRVAGAVAGLLAVLAGTLVVVGFLLARPLALLLAPGFSGERLELTVTLTRILFPGIGFLVLSAWCLGILNTHRRFFLSYVAPVFWNVAQIAVVIALVLRGTEGTDLVVGLAWGAFAGSVLQFGVQVPTVRRLARPLRLSLRYDIPGVRTVLSRFGPVVVGRGAVQLAAYIDLLLASLLAAGAVSALGYAQVIYLLPISLFGMSVAAAELPELSRLAAGDPSGEAATRTAPAALHARLGEGLARIAFYVAPISVVYLVLGDFVVGAILETGEFDADDTRLVWLVLGGFTLGLIATTSSRLLQNTLYAVGDARTPARAAIVSVVISAVVGAVLMLQLDRVVVDGLRGFDRLPSSLTPLPDSVRETGPLRLGAVGLALAASLSSWVEFFILRHRLRGLAIPVVLGGGQLARMGAASAVVAMVGLGLRPLVDGLPPLLALPLTAGPAAVAYLGVTLALGVPEAVALVGRVARHRR